MKPPRAALLLAFPVALSIAPSAVAEAQEVDLRAAKKVYRRACEECHGPAGHGDGEKARSLGFRARDFSHGSFKCRCTPTGALPTDDDLLRVVEHGIPGTPMTAHADDLSAEERRAVVAYVKTLAPRFAAETAPDCIEVPEPPPLEPSALHEGRIVYRLLGCAKCHGATGEADGPSAKGLVDDWGDPIRVHNFVRSGKLKCGGDPRDLYRTLHTGMNGSPMPSFTAAFAFAREDIGDLAPLATQLGAAAADEVRAYLAEEPDREAVRAMSEGERRALIDRRSWALVAYVRSLR